MLDHMARGRFQWGIGGGAHPHRSLPLRDQPVGGACALRGGARRRHRRCGRPKERFSYHGKFFDIETPPFDPVKDRGYYMKPLQRPHPPIAVAASTPDSSSMKMAGERGWIPMSSSLLARSYLADHWRLVESGAEKGADGPATRGEWRIARDILVGPTPAVARERARAVLGRNYERTPASEPDRHHPDAVDEAGLVDPGRCGDRRLPHGERLDRRRSVRGRRQAPPSSTRRAAASARCSRSPPTPTTRAGITRACAS